MNKILTINGNGHKIDGSGLSTGVFIQNNHFSSGDYGLSISNLIITNVNASIIVSSGIQFNNVTVTNCNAYTILDATNGGGSSILSDSRFIDNTANHILFTDYMNFKRIDKNVFLNNSINATVIHINGGLESLSNNVFINDNNEVYVKGDLSEVSGNYNGSDGITINGSDKINASSVYTFSIENKNLPEFELMAYINPVFADLNTTSVILGGGKTASLTVTPVNTGSANLTIGSGLVCNPIGTKEISTEVSKIGTNITLTNETFNLQILGNVSAGAALTPADAGTLSYASSNESVAKVENGTIIAMGEGIANITVSFDGNANYSAAESKVITVNVSRIPTEIRTGYDTFDIAAGTNDTLDVIIVPDNAGNLTFVSGNTSIVTVNDEGVIVGVAVGSANITVSFKGNDIYAASQNKTILVNVKELAEMNITADEITVGDNLTINVVLPENATGNISAVVGNTTYTANVTNGSASLIIPNLTDGNYVIPVKYSGDDTFAPLTREINATVNPDFNLTVSDVDKYFGGNESLIISAADNEGNPLNNVTAKIVINNKTSGRQITNGTAVFPINLPPGEYVASVTVNNYTKEANVTVKSTVNASDMKKYYRNGTQFYASFLDSEGNILANQNVSFNINGVFYNRKTNENGTAKLNINLPVGNYTITSTNPATGENAANNITVLSTITGDDIVKYYKNGTQYTATFLDGEGNPLNNGTASFNINGVMYGRKIVNGTAKLNINLPPGNYTITAMNPDNNQTFSNNIEVLTTIITDDLFMYSNDRIPFVAHIISGNSSSVFDDIKLDLSNITDVLSKFNVRDISKLNTSDVLNLVSKISNVTADIGDIAAKHNITAFNSIIGNIKNHTGNLTDIVNSINNGTLISLINEAASKLNATLVNLTEAFKKVTVINGTEVDINATLAKLTNYVDFISKFKVENIAGFNATKSLEFIKDLLNTTSNIAAMLPSFDVNSSTLISPILNNINISSFNLSESIKAIDNGTLISLINGIAGNLNVTLENLTKGIGLYGDPEAPAVNVTVKFNINGVLYTRTTNATGDAKLNINLPVKDYVITTTYNGLSVANNIKVAEQFRIFTSLSSYF